MGKLILCSGSRTERPYGFPSIGIRVYSIEELCYFLYHHVYLIDDDMFCDALFDWIGNELKLPERAEKLRQQKKQNASLKTLVTIILCSADYYTEHEIKGLLKILDEIIGMPIIKRTCVKAGSYLRDKQYAEAAVEYERIINSKEAADLTPEEYGDLFHNMAVAKIHITGLIEASRLFYEAYERNQREESLRQYLFTLKLSGNDEEYKKKAQEYQISDEFSTQIEEYLKQKEKEALGSDKMVQIQKLSRYIDNEDLNEYYKKCEEIMNTWKAKVRQL